MFTINSYLFSVFVRLSESAKLAFLVFLRDLKFVGTYLHYFASVNDLQGLICSINHVDGLLVYQKHIIFNLQVIFSGFAGVSTFVNGLYCLTQKNGLKRFI